MGTSSTLRPLLGAGEAFRDVVRSAPNRVCTGTSTSTSRGAVRGDRARIGSSRLRVRARSDAENAESAEVFQGQFGTWKVEKDDEREVFLYRLGLSVASASFGLSGACLILGLADRNALLNALFVSGSAGFGVALWMIHIYLAPAKRFLQGLFLVGLLGISAYTLRSDASDCANIAHCVSGHADSVWFVGPLFASITGVGFKEGVCYNKTEAFALAVLTPILLLTHLSGLADGSPIEAALLAAWIATFAAFALGKFSQPVHEDIGDKSVFTFLKLTEEEQQDFLRQRESGKTM